MIISRERAYHGLAGYGTSIVGTEAFKVGVGPLAGGTARVAWDSAEALEATIREIGAERVAAFFCEPIIGAGGVLLPPDGYLHAVREICRAHGVLFVADEVICGYGRVGDWFACSRVGLDPDAVTFAKGITSGYVPLGGVIVGRTIQEPFWNTRCGGRVAPRLHVLGPRERRRRRAREPRHHRARGPRRPRARARDRDPGRARAAARPRARERDPRRASAPSPRSRSTRRCSPTIPGSPTASRSRARDHGVLTRTLVGGGLQISPPLVITRAELDEIASGLARRARRRRCRALAAGTAPRGSRGPDPSGRSCGTRR